MNRPTRTNDDSRDVAGSDLGLQSAQPTSGGGAKYLPHYIIICLYAILTIVFTYPIAFSGNSVPVGGDAFQFLWNLWWFKASLSSLSNVYHTPYLFYPTGLNLALTALTPFNSILSIPLQWVFGLTRAYNLLCLLSFLLGGYGTYLLVKRLTGNGYAGFVSGLIFMFCPYHFAHHFGHLNLLAIEWIPFYALFLIKMVKESKLRNAIYAAIFLVLASLCDFNYMVYLLAFTVLYFGNVIVVSKPHEMARDVTKRAAISFAVFSIMIFPFAYPMLKELAISRSNYMYAGGSEIYSADLLAFVIPSEFHPLFGSVVKPIYHHFTGNVAEYTVFAGYTVLLLSLVALLKTRTKEVYFWGACALIFSILSLGPTLHVGGVITGMPLPFKLLVHVPVIGMARVPSRWDVLVMLSLAVLAGYGLRHVVNRFEGTYHGIPKPITLTIVVSSLVVFEFLAIPFPMASTKVPEFYHRIAKDTESYVIYEIPDYGYHLSFPDYMYNQTVHGKKLLTGYGKVPDDATKFIRDTPFINDMYFMYGVPKTRNDADILEQNIAEIGPSILNYYDIRYLVLHKNLMSKDQLDYANLLLQNSLGEKPFEYDGDSLVVYRVPKTLLKTFMLIGDNWHELQGSDDGTTTRWMSNNATIYVYSDRDYDAALSFKTVSFYKPRTLEVYVNTYMAICQQVPTDLTSITKTISLRKGDNLIRFHVPEGCDRPSIVSRNSGGARDTRALSLAFKHVVLDR